MSLSNEQRIEKIRQERFPVSLFFSYYLVLFLVAGVHTGLIVLGHGYQRWPELLQILVPMGYWAAVATGLTLYTRRKMKATYEIPLQNLAKATKKVSEGDFSVYVRPLHTENEMDYLDGMIMNFNKMVEELGSIETLKTDFVSNVSHEMKTPLTIIRNSAQMLQMDSLSGEEKKEYAKGIYDAAGRMNTLIVNILKLNKLENQRITPEAETYNVSPQICEALLQFEDAWEEKGIELEVDVEDQAMVKADESFLELVWNNLFSNAVKFTEPGGRIAVTQMTKGERIWVSVSDTGCGMKEETRKHIFDKFYQGDTSHSKEGNGLGLALVKRVLELVDGTIEVDSEEGKGSTFYVTLPIAAAEEMSKDGEET